MRIEFDLSHEEEPLQRVLDVCELTGNTLVEYHRHGPGGGNPQFVVDLRGSVTRLALAEAFMLVLTQDHRHPYSEVTVSQ